MSSSEFPKQIITNTETKAVTLTPKIENALPGVLEAFRQVDKAFLNDPEKYLQNLEASIFKFDSSEGSEVACSLLHSPSSRPDELLVIFAPFSDSHPKSSAKDIHEYITSDSPGGIINKEKASPNSWSQTTKSAVIFELLGALGENLPVLTVYSPIPSRAYSYKERKSLRKGDFTPAARLAKEAVTQVQDRLHGRKSETQIDTIHLHGTSLGASNAIGASSGLVNRYYEVPTVTAQELIMGPKSLPDLGKRFTVSQYVGEPSDELLSLVNPKIEESAMRKAIDKQGSEPVGMTIRMIKGMKPTYMRGLTKPEAAVEAMERLLDNNVSLLVALAESSALTHQTANYLFNGREKLIQIRGESGQLIGHLVDEHVALSGLVVALNVARKQ